MGTHAHTSDQPSSARIPHSVAPSPAMLHVLCPIAPIHAYIVDNEHLTNSETTREVAYECNGLIRGFDDQSSIEQILGHGTELDR